MDFMILGMAAVATAGLLMARRMGGSGVPGITATDTQALTASGGCLLLDVRTVGEWKSGRIAGATHVPLIDLVARCGELPASRSIVVYCATGMRSRIAAGVLLKKGFDDVRNMTGGINAWQRQGLPVER